MYPSSMIDELLSSLDHPSLVRFSKTIDDDVSVLVVHAPHGSGVDWLLRGFCPDRARVTINVALDSYPQSSETLGLPSSGAASHSRPSVVILESTRFSWDLLAGISWQMVGAADLMLSAEEIAEFLTSVATSGVEPEDIEDEIGRAEEARRIYQLTGGWLEPTLKLVKNPADTEQARATMLPLVADWINRVGGGTAMAMAAHLSSFTPTALEALFREIDCEPTSAEAMVAAGVLREDDRGDYFLPTLVGECLKTLVQQKDPAATDALTEAALKALVISNDLETALEIAPKRRKWHVATRILGDPWPELFTSDARDIKRVISLLPRPVIIEAFGDAAGVAVRMAMGAGAERMTFPLPTTEPHYPSDPVAQRLRTQSEQLAQTPDHQALTIGLLELGHLRVSGHYTYSVGAASHLRRTLDRALSMEPIRPLLASVIELQTGISLHIGGRRLEAKHAYESALYWAESADSAFQHAYATSNLALLAAHSGYTQEARHWLQQHEKSIDSVGWGKSMVARGAHLARALNALAELDLATATAILDTLPPEPDTDEFWPAHAYTLALRDTLAGRPYRALASTVHLRQERPYASKSVLAEQLLNLADRIALLHAPTLNPTAPGNPRTRNAEQSRFFEVLHRLLLGDIEAARTLVQAIPLTQIGPRWRNITTTMYDFVDMAPPPGASTSLVDEVLNGAAELIDLVLPYVTGALKQSGDLARLSPEQHERLSKLPSVTLSKHARPQLTNREISVLHQLRLGRNRKAIAEADYLSENTVKAQIRSLYKKLNACSLEEALEAALKWGY